MYNQETTTFRERISAFYRNSDVGYYLTRPLYKVYELILKCISDETIVKNSFKKHMGYSIDLDNPETLNEKINWLKLYNKNDLQTLVADKYKVRDYVTNKIGKKYLIPLILETKNPSDLVNEKLPNKPFIIKTNHDSSGGLIVRDKSNLNWPSVQKRFKRLLKENHFWSTREWQYKNIEPRIVVEELLTYEDGSIPDDYKLHCFNGKLAFVMIDFDRHSGKRTRNLYDHQWNHIPRNWGRPFGKELQKPEKFEEMKNLAEKLAKDFIYARVDFYYVKNKIYFGEITFHHASGFQKFYKMESDLYFGKMLQLNLRNNE
jgi:hypothetical protein